MLRFDSDLRWTGRCAGRTLLAAALIAAAFATTGESRADDVTLKSGKVRQGRVVSEDERFVILETRLGRIRIPASEVESVTRDEAQPTDAGDGTSSGTPEAGADDRPHVPPRRAVVRRRKPDAARNGEANGETDAPATAAPSAEVEAEKADRLSQLRRSRVVRRTNVDDEPETAAAGPEMPTPVATIGGLDLAKVPQGTEVIVFQPPRPFAAAPQAIEIGRRLVARMEMAGVKSAWMTVPGPEGEERVAVRLADVKRHIDISDPEALLRIFEGVDTGDWVRVRLNDGSTVEGGLEMVAEGAARLICSAGDGKVERKAIRCADVVQVDGMLRDRTAHLTLGDIERDELVAVTFWPAGDQVMGRYVEGGSDALALDLDDDGTADRRIMRAGPVAEVRRVPARHRDFARKLRAGDVVRMTFREEFPDAVLRRNHIGRVAAMTAFNLSVEDGRDAMVVPFESISELAIIEDRPEAEIAKWGAVLDTERATREFVVLPGMKLTDVRASGLDKGVTTLDDGRRITHVFISAPFDDEAFGVRMGEPVLQAVRRSPLRFHTTVMPRLLAGSEPEAQQTISQSIEGVRFVILGDDLGIVTGIEMTRVE
jgi:hypothetical protein